MNDLQSLCGEAYLKYYYRNLYKKQNYDETKGTGLKQIDWKKKKYADMHAFFDSLGIDIHDFLEASENSNINKDSVSRRIDQNNPPVIKTVIMDWDGTIGNYYEKFAETLNVFLNHIAITRNINNRFELEDILKDQVKKDDEVGRLLFSKDGCRQILSQYYSGNSYQEPTKGFFKAIDEYFLDQILVNMQKQMYSDTYEDAKLMIEHLNYNKVPIIVHTDSPLAEFIQKLQSTDLIKFATVDGKIVVTKSVFSGLSINSNINVDDQYTAPYVEALERAGIFVILNNKDEAKPNATPFNRIKYRMAMKGYEVKSTETLVIGDHLRKDGMFAKNIGSYFAWPGQLTVMSPLAVAMNRVSAGGWDKFKNRFLAQLNQLLNMELITSEDRKDFISRMSICHDYSQLYSSEAKFFTFKAPEKTFCMQGLYNISSLCTVKEIYDRQRILG